MAQKFSVLVNPVGKNQIICEMPGKNLTWMVVVPDAGDISIANELVVLLNKNADEREIKSGTALEGVFAGIAGEKVLDGN